MSHSEGEINPKKEKNSEGEMTRRNQSQMRKSNVAILLLGALFASYMGGLDLKVEARIASPLSEIEIDAKLKLLNKPAVKSIKSDDGDIIDCVDIYKQPAFDHPALKNHTIQTVPTFFKESQNSSTKDAFQSKSIVFQTWQKSGSCPKGTIPIRRIRKEDLVRHASGLDRFGMKPPAQFNNSTDTRNLTFPPDFNFPNHSFIVFPENRSASYLVTLGYNFIGAQADINVWNPNVDLPEDFTTAQIWLKAGHGADFESVESGWVVNPKLYGDKRTRLFAYWTLDSYQSTGCFDLTCSGFVQTGTQVALGAAIEPISSFDPNKQYDINIGMFLDDSENWWLKFKHDIPIGYWPAKVLNSLRQSAILVEFGGQVFSPQVKKTPHTRTGMGSGDFADGLWGNACFMRNVRIKDYSQSLKYPKIISAAAQEPYCYNSLNYARGYGVEPVFYFGGPGQRPPYCP